MSGTQPLDTGTSKSATSRTGSDEIVCRPPSQPVRVDCADVIGGSMVIPAAPCDLATMATYDVTGSESKGFQVNVTGPSGTNLIGDFGTLQEAEVFADQMRVIDADRSHSAVSSHACHDPAGDT
jgi:hypothetical protein